MQGEIFSIGLSLLKKGIFAVCEGLNSVGTRGQTDVFAPAEQEAKFPSGFFMSRFIVSSRFNFTCCGRFSWGGW